MQRGDSVDHCPGLRELELWSRSHPNDVRKDPWPRVHDFHATLGHTVPVLVKKCGLTCPITTQSWRACACVTPARQLRSIIDSRVLGPNYKDSHGHLGAPTLVCKFLIEETGSVRLTCAGTQLQEKVGVPQSPGSANFGL